MGDSKGIFCFHIVNPLGCLWWIGIVWWLQSESRLCVAWVRWGNWWFWCVSVVLCLGVKVVLVCPFFHHCYQILWGLCQVFLGVVKDFQSHCWEVSFCLWWGFGFRGVKLESDGVSHPDFWFVVVILHDVVLFLLLSFLDCCFRCLVVKKTAIADVQKEVIFT